MLNWSFFVVLLRVFKVWGGSGLWDKIGGRLWEIVGDSGRLSRGLCPRVGAGPRLSKGLHVGDCSGLLVIARNW